jgi:hypothetical protein
MRSAIAISLILVASVARADAGDEESCQRSYVAGQRHHKLEHDFISARAELLVCAKTCPDELRVSCGRWLEEIAHEIPSIVVRVLDGRGHDIPNVELDLDHAPIDHYVEGLPIEMNAGTHSITARREGHAPVTQSIVVNAGEKLRVIDLWTEPRQAATWIVRRPVPGVTWALLAVSGVALATFGVFASWTTNEFSSTSACAPHCLAANKDSAFDAKAAVADVSLGIAALAFVGAGIFYLARPTLRTERSLSAVPWISPRAGGIAFRTTF